MTIIILVLLLILMTLFILNQTDYFTTDDNLKDVQQQMGNNKVLGLCFLIYDKINYEELWHNWLKNVDKKKYKIYIHYKKDIKLKYLEKNKLDNCIKTKYADISLVKAQNLLLKASVNDNCTHQILLSNSCIPLKSFDYVYTKLNLGTSYFNLRYNNIKPHVKLNRDSDFDLSKIHKASQWCILSKDHSKIILKDDVVHKELSKSYAPDELLYITILYGYKNEIIMTKDLSSGATTFTNWSNMSYPYKNKGFGLKNYNVITKEEIEYLIKQPCLFGRKFNLNCKVILSNDDVDQLSNYLTKRIC